MSLHPAPPALRALPPKRSPGGLHRFGRGFSLIELMVSLAIGLIVTLAITGVMTRSEGIKRTSTSLNDANQTGAYVSYVVDRALRAAGSGFMQTWTQGGGCIINASKGGNVLLPAPAAFPMPFQSVGKDIALAPVVIGRGLSSAGSDTLTVLAGAGGFGESALPVLTGSVTSSSIGLNNTLTFSGGDLVMLVEDGIGCTVEQVTAGFKGTPDTLPNTNPPNQTLPLSGSYMHTDGLTQFGAAGSAYLVSLGNATALGNTAGTSQFQVFGVGDNSTLYSYDLLQLAPMDPARPASVPIADGVIEMRALYGVDTNNDGRLDSWVQPGTDAGNAYSAVTLTSGSAAAKDTLRTIVSIKVGFILRASLYERDIVSPSSLTLFSDLGTTLTQTRDLSTDEQHYRYRTIEVTVPLRNVLMLGST